MLYESEWLRIGLLEIKLFQLKRNLQVIVEFKSSSDWLFTQLMLLQVLRNCTVVY